MKRNISILMILIMVLASLSICCNAESKEYEISSADISIRLNKDGSADVVENWDVKYISGTFSRFYKEIYTTLPEEEQFSSFGNLKVFIDGRECEFTNDTDNRPDFHYNYERASSEITMSAFLHTSNASRHTYKFVYNLKGIVKELNDNEDQFCYRVIGSNFDKTINHLTVTISPPDSCKIDSLIRNHGNIMIEDNRIKYQIENSSGLFKVRIKMSGAGFNDIERIVDESEQDDEQKQSDIFFIIVVIIYFFTGLIIVYMFIIRNVVIYIKSQRNFEEVIKPWSSIMSPTNLATFMDERNIFNEGIHRIFLIYLARLMQIGYIIDNNDGTYKFEKSIQGKTPYYHKIIDRFLNYSVENKNAFTIDELMTFCWNNPKKCYLLDQEINAELHSFHRRFYKNHKEYSKQLIFWRIDRNVLQLKLSKKKKDEVLFEQMLNSFNHETVLSYLWGNNTGQYSEYYSDFDRFSAIYYNACINGWDIYKKEMHNSGSGYVGGSSCGGCGGCGGGGAD